MKNLILGMITLAMLTTVSCTAQRTVTDTIRKDSMKTEVIVIHEYDDVYSYGYPWYQNAWPIYPYYTRPHYRRNFIHPGNNLVEKRDPRPQGRQYRGGRESMKYNSPGMRPGMRGNMNKPMQPGTMHQGMQNKQPGMMRQGMQNNRPPQQQMRSNPGSGATRSTPIRKGPSADEYDMPMEDFIQYQNYKE